MDRRERTEDLTETLKAALAGWQAGIWTALPCIVQSFDPARMTCVLQPAIQAYQLLLDGSNQWITMPLLVDCPVVFPGAGGFVMTFPLEAGDEVLAILASRCIDSWWQSGGIQVQAELRMHDLSDAFVIPGIRSVPRVIPNISTSAIQIRNEAGTSYVEINDAGNINIVAPVVNVIAPQVNVVASTGVLMTTPELKVTGEITAFEGTPDEISLSVFGDKYDIHTHNDVTNGPDITGPTSDPL